MNKIRIFEFSKDFFRADLFLEKSKTVWKTKLLDLKVAISSIFIQSSKFCTVRLKDLGNRKLEFLPKTTFLMLIVIYSLFL